jgi:hypothetical protein
MEFARRFAVAGDLIVATGHVDDDLIRRVRQAPRPLLVLNRELGFDEVDCAVLRDVGDRLVGLEVSGSFADDSDVRLCSTLEELNLDTDCRGSVDWAGLAGLTRLFVYADRLSEGFSSLGKLHTLQVYGASDEHAGQASALPLLEDLTLISTRMRTTAAMGSTDVQDGDLSVLGQLPALRGAYFQRRRHYRGTPPGFPTLDD